MRAYKRAIENRTNTPQTMAIPGREKEMEVNSAGGVVFTITPMAQMLRFLILGSEGGTFYVGEHQLTADNTSRVTAVLNSKDGLDAVELIRKVSVEGRAPKISPTLYALAIAYASERKGVRRAAAKAMPEIVRTNAHMLEFIGYVTGLRGWGRLLRESVGNWYNNMDAKKLSYQVAKYRQRAGWTTRDVLRLAKPVPPDLEHSAAYAWAAGKSVLEDSNDMDRIEQRAATAKILWSLEEAATMPELETRASTFKALNLIRDGGLTREMIPTGWLNNLAVWDALLETMPLTAMIRNLGKMSSIGLLMPLAKTTQIVCDRLHDEAYLQASRIHPFNVLLALSTYKKGMGVRGKLTWSPVTQIIGGLQDAFYASFKNVNPTGKRHMIALDVSGSMGWAIINNSHLSARGAAAAMAMVTARTEVRHMFTAFATTFKKLNITPNSSLDFIIDTVKRMRFGATDCAQPMLYAAKNKIPVDVFIIYTDNETWAGKPHPSQALQMYRDKMGINAKLVVVGMTSTKFSIADPTDPGMLDIVGFDSNCPSLISNFTAGDTAYV